MSEHKLFSNEFNQFINDMLGMINNNELKGELQTLFSTYDDNTKYTILNDIKLKEYVEKLTLSNNELKNMVKDNSILASYYAQHNNLWNNLMGNLSKLQFFVFLDKKKERCDEIIKTVTSTLDKQFGIINSMKEKELEQNKEIKPPTKSIKASAQPLSALPTEPTSSSEQNKPPTPPLPIVPMIELKLKEINTLKVNTDKIKESIKDNTSPDEISKKTTEVYNNYINGKKILNDIKGMFKSLPTEFNKSVIEGNIEIANKELELINSIFKELQDKLNNMPTSYIKYLKYKIKYMKQ